MKYLSLALLLTVSSCMNPVFAEPSMNIRQTTMLQTLQQVITIFSEEYAPFEWKVKSEKFDLSSEAKAAREQIEKNPSITTPEFQDILHNFVLATRDFHVSVSFYSTEAASLPFQVMGAGGRYFVVAIDRAKMPKIPGSPFDVGTEVTHFDGVEIKDVVRALVPERFKEPSPTEFRLAEMQLTSRQREGGFKVPNGEIIVTVRNKDGEATDIPFVWEYTPEYLPVEMPVRSMLSDTAERESGAPRLTTTPDQKPAPSPANNTNTTGSYDIGGRSIVPTLGTVLGANEYFDSYIFRLPKGHVIGYVRIPTFEVEKPAEATDIFGRIMTSFDEKTDALVIDLTHNGGGSMSYLYGLLSHLAIKPLTALSHQIMVSSAMAADSAQRLTIATFVKTDEQAKKIMAPMFPGMSVDFQTFQSVVNNDRFILSELKAGRRLTRPTSLLGISRIPPHPDGVYKKPILVLVDELDFSSADFFPAILQDNGRAKIFGVRTAGAGGAVKSTEFPNQFGVRKLNYTWTIAQRLDGGPLENVGVTPDIPYSISVEDLRNGFQEYKAAVVKALENLLAERAQ